MLRDSTTGQGLTGKVHSDFSGKYNIAGGAEVTLSFSAGTAGDAYSSGKICDLGLGKYAWHVPNAVFASLGNVSAVLSVTGGIDVHCEWLVVAAVRDSVAFGANTTAPPTASAVADEVQTRTIARVTLVDTCTVNSDMRGTDSALTTLGSNAPVGWLDAAAFSSGAFDAVWTVTTRGLTEEVELDSSTQTQIGNIESTVSSMGSQATTVERSVSDVNAITFAWPVSGATITGTRSLNNGSYGAVTGAIAFLRTETGKHYYTLAYNSADRPAAEGQVRYQFIDGTYTGYVVLRTATVVLDSGTQTKIDETHSNVATIASISTEAF